MSRTLEQKIADAVCSIELHATQHLDAEARLQRLKAKSRSLDTAQKVVVGAALLAKVRKPEEVQLRAWLLQFLKAEVTRQADVTRILPLINELEALPGQ
ncbi:mobilization protein [Escherichia coli]|nr:mobilization protein [Escherichia coli]